MVETIRQRVTVQEGGRLLLQSPELHDGESVEVIVMTERPAAGTSAERLSALRELRTRLNLTSGGAEHWVEEIRRERAETNRRADRA